jgi:hypothetical protein
MIDDRPHVFVAGATGVIGRSLVPLLVEPSSGPPR